MPELELWHEASRFRFRPEKAAEAIDFIARAQPGLTQYFVGKVLYLADKEHFLDWGRPITFDRYVAMVHGPVPSAVRNMLAAAAGVEAGMDEERFALALENAELLHKRVRVELEVRLGGERQRVFPHDTRQPFEHLSRSDQEALAHAVRVGGQMSFGALREETHKDEAWRTAWYGREANRKVANIDIALWAAPQDRDAAREHLRRYVAVGR